MGLFWSNLSPSCCRHHPLPLVWHPGHWSPPINPLPPRPDEVMSLLGSRGPWEGVKPGEGCPPTSSGTPPLLSSKSSPPSKPPGPDPGGVLYLPPSTGSEPHPLYLDLRSRGTLPYRGLSPPCAHLILSTTSRGTDYEPCFMDEEKLFSEGRDLPRGHPARDPAGLPGLKHAVRRPFHSSHTKH